MTSAISKLLALLLVFLAAGPSTLAEAQRGRRRRRPVRRPPVAAPAEPTSDVEESAASETAANDSVADDGDARPEDTGAASRDRAAARRAPEPPQDDSEERAQTLRELQNDYTNLMDELVQLRSRASVIAGQLFTTRMRVVVVNESGDDTILQKVRLTLDGAPVFQVGASELGDDEREAFEGALSPGYHVFGVELEQRQRANRDYRYTLRDDYRFEVRPSTRTELRLVIEDDSDVGEAFEDSSETEAEGEFEVRTEIEIEQVEVQNGQGQGG